MKKSSFVKFHVKQGLVLLITAVIFSFFYGVLVFIPILGWLIICVLQLFVLVLFIIGIVNALNGKENTLPIIGGLAKKFTF